MPHIFLAIDNVEEEPSIRKSACYAMESFSDSLGKIIVPYLETMCKKLLHLAHDKEPMVRESAVSALKSVALAAEDAFLPFSEIVLKFLIQLMTVTGFFSSFFFFLFFCF